MPRGGLMPPEAAATALSPSAGICRISSEIAKACRRSRSIAAPIVSSAAFVTASAAWPVAKSSDRCYWGSTTKKVSSITSGSPRP